MEKFQKLDLSFQILRDLHHEHNLQKARFFVIILAVTNLLPALYFCLIHQRGTVTVTKFIHEVSIRQPDIDVLFLMPCHSTPYYRYFKKMISDVMHSLTDSYHEYAFLFYKFVVFSNNICSSSPVSDCLVVNHSRPKRVHELLHMLKKYSFAEN